MTSAARPTARSRDEGRRLLDAAHRKLRILQEHAADFRADILLPSTDERPHVRIQKAFEGVLYCFSSAVWQVRDAVSWSLTGEPAPQRALRTVLRGHQDVALRSVHDWWRARGDAAAQATTMRNAATHEYTNKALRDGEWAIELAGEWLSLPALVADLEELAKLLDTDHLPALRSWLDR